MTVSNRKNNHRGFSFRPTFIILHSTFLIFFSGCFVKKELAKKKIIPDKSPEVVFHELKKNELQFDWLGLKADAQATIDNKSNSFKIAIRIRRDSLIWLSASSLLGVEALRVHITPDSIKFIDKINSLYYTGSMDSLSEKFDIDADFEMLQSLLIGNSIDLKDTADLKISVQKGDYLLSSLKKRKLKKILRKNEKLERKSEKLEKKNISNDTEKKSERMERKSEKLEKEEEKYDMILQSIWIEPEIFKITKTAIYDLKTNHSLIAEYGNFSSEENQKIPQLANFYSESKKNTKLKLEYSKITINIPQSVPFNIPENYERRF